MDELTDHRIENKLLSKDDFNKGTAGINKEIEDFDYNLLLGTLKNQTKLIKIYENTTDNFAKTILFRILVDNNETKDKIDTVLQKFINRPPANIILDISISPNIYLL